MGTEIDRGLIVDIPSQIHMKSFGKKEEIDPGIHGGLIVFIHFLNYFQKWMICHNIK